MTTLYYSPESQGFYTSDVHDVLPPDAVEISAERHTALLEAQAAGQRIVFDAGTKQPVAEAIPVSMEEYRQIKITELTGAFNTALNVGFDSDALGSTHRYDSEAHNRENLIGAVATGVAQRFTCDDGKNKANSKRQRRHTAEQLKQVLIDGAARKQALIARLREKRAAVLAASNETQVNAITWSNVSQT